MEKKSTTHAKKNTVKSTRKVQKSESLFFALAVIVVVLALPIGELFAARFFGVFAFNRLTGA